MSELETLRAELAAHYHRRPELPRPYRPESLEAREHQADLQAWVNAEQRLISKIHGLECAVTFDRMEPGSRVPRVYTPPPVRLRQ